MLDQQETARARDGIGGSCFRFLHVHRPASPGLGQKLLEAGEKRFLSLSHGLPHSRGGANA